MSNNMGPVEEEVKFILLSSRYLLTLKEMGYSKEFRLREQVRKQQECIEFLAQKVDELKKEISEIRKSKYILEKIA